LYVIQQTSALRLFQKTIIPVLAAKNLHNEISTLNNAFLEFHLMLLRKLNEFFTPLCKGNLKEDDLRAEHYPGFVSPGPFLSDSDVDELHKRVGHITLMNVRYKEKNWGELIEGSLPRAIDKLLEFFRFLTDSPSLSNPVREDVRFCIKRLEGLKTLAP
jgi:hypothetical protein